MILITIATLNGCDSDTVDAYNVCRITSSGAILATDRANDLQQCWNGLGIKNKHKALSACEQLASKYIASKYLVGHAVEVQVTNEASCD